jgi:hypothetical protein
MATCALRRISSWVCGAHIDVLRLVVVVSHGLVLSAAGVALGAVAALPLTDSTLTEIERASLSAKPRYRQYLRLMESLPLF